MEWDEFRILYTQKRREALAVTRSARAIKTSRVRRTALRRALLWPFRSLWPPCVASWRRRIGVMRAPVSTFEETVERLEPWSSDIRALGVERLALFGPVLRGQTRSDSDADVLVRFAIGEKSYDRYRALTDLLEDALGRSVEIVTTESLSPVLGPKIVAEARDVLRADGTGCQRQ